MDIRQIEYFAVVAKQENYTKAAEDLYISRQALSKAIKNLEQEVGRALFSAKDNHVQLTDDGKAHGVKPDIVLTTSDVNLLIRTAISQQAFFFGFSKDIEDIEVQGHVLLPLEGDNADAFGTYAIKRKGATLSAPARAFWELISITE